MLTPRNTSIIYAWSPVCVDGCIQDSKTGGANGSVRYVWNQIASVFVFRPIYAFHVVKMSIN